MTFVCPNGGHYAGHTVALRYRWPLSHLSDMRVGSVKPFARNLRKITRTNELASGQQYQVWVNDDWQGTLHVLAWHDMRCNKSISSGRTISWRRV